MELFRLAREPYSHALSGKGAAIKGARWNSPGMEVIYTASNRSLAMAEVAVYLTLATLPSDYMMATIYVPEDISSKKVAIDDLPEGWNRFPHPLFTRAIGDRFIIDNRYLLLQIPSAVVKGEFNLLINPAHREFEKVKIIDAVKFPFDDRIFK